MLRLSYVISSPYRHVSWAFNSECQCLLPLGKCFICLYRRSEHFAHKFSQSLLMMRVTCSTIKAGNSNGSEGRKHGEYNQSYQDILSAYFLPMLSLALRSTWPTSHVSGNVTNNAGKGQHFLPHDVYYCDEDILTCPMNPKKLQFVTQASPPTLAPQP